MANSLMSMMRGAPAGINMQAVQQVRQMMSTLNALKNPQKVIEEVAQQNPELNETIQMCQGRNPQEVFYEECKKKGVKPDDILSQLR